MNTHASEFLIEKIVEDSIHTMYLSAEAIHSWLSWEFQAYFDSLPCSDWHSVQHSKCIFLPHPPLDSLDSHLLALLIEKAPICLWVFTVNCLTW